VPAQFVKGFVLRVAFPFENLLMLCKRDGPFDLISNRWPLFFGENGPRQPIHIEAKVVQFPQMNVGRHCSRLEHGQEVRGLSFDYNQLANTVECLIPLRSQPSCFCWTILGANDGLEDILPGPFGNLLIARRQIGFGNLPVYGRLQVSFIPGMKQSQRFIFISGSRLMCLPVTLSMQK
jgi:hypothetical protein